MTDTRALVERLNTDAAYLRHRAHETLRTIGNDCEEAATAISALEAALAEARAVAAEPGSAYGIALEHAERAQTAEAERDRLKEALRPMVARFELYAGPNDMHAGTHDLALLKIAREALSLTPDEVE